MPLSMIGRCTSQMISSRSVCSMRVAKPPPVDIRQSPSDSHSGTDDRLSKAKMCEFMAETIRSRSSFGVARIGAALGSISNRNIRANELFPVPCSPLTMSIGYGPFGRSAATNHAQVSMKSASVLTLTRSRKRSMPSPASGTGIGRMAGVRMNLTGGSTTTDHPCGVTLTALQASSQRSK